MSPQSDTGCVGAVALLGVEPEALLYRRPQSSLSWRRSPDRGIASRFTQVLTALCKRLMDHMKSLITRFIKSVQTHTQKPGEGGAAGRNTRPELRVTSCLPAPLCHLTFPAVLSKTRVLSKGPALTEGNQSNTHLAGRWPAEQPGFHMQFLGKAHVESAWDQATCYQGWSIAVITVGPGSS